MVHKHKLSKNREDDPNNEAPLFYLKMKVQPIPENGGSSDQEASDRLVAPLSKEDEIHVGCEVEVAGLVTRVDLTSVRGRCLGEAQRDGRWLVKTADGRALNVKSENIRRLDVLAAGVPSTSASKQVHIAVALRSPDETPSRAVVESHNLTHIPYASWC